MDVDWSPGIGDPTPFGWATVLCYFAAAALCLRSGSGADRRDRWFWPALGLAHADGWCRRRHEVQRQFLIGLLAIGTATLAVLLMMLRRSEAGLKLAIAGMALLLTFVIARAASFHHFDRLLGWRVAGLRMNWIFELGGIALIAAKRRRAPRG